MDRYCPSPDEAAAMPVGNPFTPETLDLSSSSPRIVAGSGYGVQFRREGSAPGGRVNITIGGSTFPDLYPGSVLNVPFSGGFTAERSSSSVLSGTAKLIILRSPGATFDEPPSVSSPVWNNPGALIGPGGGVAQTHNHATANAPATDTDGVSLVGVSAVRITIKALNGLAFTAGSMRLWWHDGVQWFQGYEDSDVTLRTGTGSDVQTTHDTKIENPYGRLYAEALSAANGGSGLILQVRIHTWTTA